MTGTPTAPSPEHVALLAKTIRDVARSRRLSYEDAEDFGQCVQVRFLVRGYDIFERFEGRSSLRTYLTVVVGRMLLDWRDAMYGKWRPSRAAEGLGEHAVDLERLMSRDGYSAAEAAEILQLSAEAPTVEALLELAARLPARRHRRMVSDEGLREIEGPRFVDPIEVRERESARARTRGALAAALRQLPSADRQLIQARYVHQRSVSATAHALRTDPKVLYRRYQRVLRTLRRSLTEAGVTAERVMA